MFNVSKDGGKLLPGAKRSKEGIPESPGGQEVVRGEDDDDGGRA